MTAPTTAPTSERIAELTAALDHGRNAWPIRWPGSTIIVSIGELRSILAAGARLVEAEALLREHAPGFCGEPPHPTLVPVFGLEVKGCGQCPACRWHAFLSPPPPAGKDGER